MENGRIRDIGPSVQRAGRRDRRSTSPANSSTPGIINGHGHVGPPARDPQLRQYALYGVTTTTSMYFDQDDVQEFKERQKAGDLRGARILTVMYRFMSEPFKPGSENKTPEEGRAKVDEIAAKGTDFVKVWIDAQGGRHPKLTPEFTAAVMDQAQEAQQDHGWRISSSSPTRGGWSTRASTSWSTTCATRTSPTTSSPR